MIGDTTIVIQLFARFGIDDRAVELIDRQGIVTLAQEHVVDVTIPRHFREAPMPVASFMRGNPVGGLPKRQALRERGMGVGLARKDEVAMIL